MKKIIYIFICFTFLFSTLKVNAQLKQIVTNEKPEKYLKVKIYFDNKFTVNDISKYDIDFEASKIKGNLWIETIISRRELTKLSQNNVKYDILIDDMSAYYSSRLSDYKNIKNEILTPVNFKLGSMGGYLTNSEVQTTFSDMQKKFPKYFSSMESIGNSIEDNPIYGYCFGNCKATKKNELLITGVHHAREPEGVMTIIYFLWDLLERADKGDLEANYLLSNRALYVVPIVNPDGYTYNELIAPKGGGMWRKNRRHIQDSTYGVDINRNYGPQDFWNSDNNGSSTDPHFDTYRGASPFSELETQAIRDLCQRHKFRLAMNYHTFGDDLIYPWSAKAYETPDSVYYRSIAIEFSKKTKLDFGRGTQTVGYQVSGDSDDWMYLENPNKPKIFAMTPELGNNTDGFWPAPARIIPIAQDNLYMNYQLIWSADVNLRPVDVTYVYDSVNYVGNLTVRVQNLGVNTSPTKSILNLKSLDNKIEPNNTQREINLLNSAESQSETFVIPFPKNYTNGQYVPFVVEIIQDNISRLDTFNIQMFKYESDFLFKSGMNLQNWDLGKWGLEFDSSIGENVLSDSPFGNYKDSADNYLTYKVPIPINSMSSTLEFYTRWSIEGGYDFAVVQASADTGKTWTFLETERMKKGVGALDTRQILGSFGFDGFMPYFLKQEASLDNFKGKNIILRFGMLSDQATHYDGVLLKDIKIRRYDDISSVSESYNPIMQVNYYPNPIQKGNPINVTIDLSDKLDEKTCNVRLINTIGSVCYEGTYNLSSNNIISIETKGLSSGMYFLEISTMFEKKIGKVVIIP